MTRSISFHALALSVLVTSGCQATLPLHAMRQPFFAVGQHGDQAEVAIATGPNATVGGLTVSFQGELAQWTRRVMATVADVEKVVLTVKPAGAAEVSQTVLKAALAGGQTSVTFQGLPPGEVVVTITAYDASGTTIGSAVKTASVAAGQVTSVDVTLQLAPTFPSSGGASAPTTGALAANVTILDGMVVNAAHAGAVVNTFELSFTPFLVNVDSQGHAWVSGHAPGANGSTVGRLVKFAFDGTPLRTLTFGSAVGTFAIDGQDNIWLTEASESGTAVVKVDADGNELNRYPNLPGGVPFFSTVSDDGMFMCSLTQGGFVQILPGGPMVRVPHAMAVPAAGIQQDYWASGGDQFDQLMHYSESGTLLGAVTLDDGARIHGIDVDRHGHAWVVSASGQLHKYDSAGQKLGTFPLTAGIGMGDIAFGPDEVVWVQGDTGVSRFSPSGVLLSVTPATGGFMCSMGVGRSGAWLLHGEDNQGNPSHRLTYLAP